MTRTTQLPRVLNAFPWRSLSIRSRFPILLSALGLVGVSQSEAAPPELKALHPVGVRQGEAQVVQVVGKVDPGPGQFWVSDGAGIEITPVEGESGKFQVLANEGSRIGPHWVRLYNQDGPSAPALFWIEPTGRHYIQETEPNDPPAEDAQPITSEQLQQGVALYGRLSENEDVEHFPVQLEAGQTLVVDMYCYRLGSPVDPLIHILDAEFFPLEFNHDQDDLLNLDPRLVFTASESGVYWLQVSGFAHPPQSRIRFTDDAAAVYRLELTTGGYFNSVLPIGSPTANDDFYKNNERWMGWNLESLITSGSDKALDQSIVRIPRPESSDQLVLSQTTSGIALAPHWDGSVVAESESGQSGAKSSRLNFVQPPVLITGEIQKTENQDAYLFQAEKDASYEFYVRSRALGLGVDPLVSVLDLSGKQLASSDDIAKEQPDARLEWKAPDSGWFQVVVQDRFDYAGPDASYVLEIRTAQPALEVHAKQLQMTLNPGETQELEIDVVRKNGFQEETFVFLEGLPDGVSGTLLKLGAETKKGVIRVHSIEGASVANQPAYLKTFQEGGLFKTEWHPVTGATTEAGELILNSIQEIWITVKPKPEEKKD